MSSIHYNFTSVSIPSLYGSSDFPDSRSDYSAPTPTVVTFSDCDSRQCITIPITDDEAVENSELFSITLCSLDHRVDLTGATTLVQITDNDGRYLHALTLYTIEAYNTKKYSLCNSNCYNLRCILQYYKIRNMTLTVP